MPTIPTIIVLARSSHRSTPSIYPRRKTFGTAGAIEEIPTYFQDAAGENVAQLDRACITSSFAGTVIAKFFVNDWQSFVSANTNSTGSVVEGDS